MDREGSRCGLHLKHLIPPLPSPSHTTLFCSSRSYKITSNASRPQFTPGECSVVRRFSDFTWLSQQLVRSCPGAIVPATPEKQLMGKFSSDFVESRRRSLERFLRRLSNHTELGRNENFVLFLQGDDGALKLAMETSKSPASKRLSQATSWLNDTANQLANSGKVCARCASSALWDV